MRFYNRLSLHLHQPRLPPLCSCTRCLSPALTYRALDRCIRVLQAHLELANLIVVGHGIAAVPLIVAHQMRWVVATCGRHKTCTFDRLLAASAECATKAASCQPCSQLRLVAYSLVLMIALPATRFGFPDVE